MTAISDRGRDAAGPREIPKSGWRDILLRVKDEIGADHVSIVAAGTAFFGLLALFPAIAALIAIAGLVFDPAAIAAQLQSAAAVLPADAAQILQDQASAVASGGGTKLGFAAIAGLLLTLYSASKGMKTLIEGMNIAYDEEESRGFLMLNVVALALTLLLIVGLVLALGSTVVAPVIVATLGLGSVVEGLITWARWPVLAIVAALGLAVIYRYGPSRATPRWRWISPGAVIATLIWIVGSIAFSIYARNFGSFNETYGTLGGVIILLTWLWLSAFIVLLGAEFNSEMEHQTEHDSTTGEPRPKGERGAVKADTLGRQP